VIYRPRALVTEPPSLAEVGSPGATERTSARRYYAGRRPPTGNMTFNVYSRDDVKEALERLFGLKCAYCEFDYSPGMPADVEHYRPKGGVVDEAGSLIFPGYWWLASTWSNLLPSCADCNRSRWHKVGSDTYKFGKQNLFPLPAGTVPARTPDELAAERPLLINPAEEDPARYLRYVYKRSVLGRMESVVEPLLDAHGQVDERGDKSEKTYGLNRPLLVRSRIKKIEGLKLALDAVEKDLRWADREPDPVRKEEHLVDARAALRRTIALYMNWRSEYAASCRAYYRDWYAALRDRRPVP
jgi:uncharacterized protein (TIGR02646 family)